MPRLFLDKAAQLLRGQSYWQVKLTTGKVYSELDQPVRFEPDPITGKLVARKRAIDWYWDIVGSGDCAHIAEIHLITPQGDACLPIHAPYSAFQISRGTMLPMTGQRIKNMQLIGRVENRETGACVAAIWDALEQKLYTDHWTTVKNFAAWRDGVAPVQGMPYDVLGIRVEA